MISNVFDRHLFIKSYPYARVILGFIVFFQLIAAVAILITLIGGLNAPILRNLAWLTGTIDVHLNQPILFHSVSVNSGTLYNYWFSMWTFCEHRNDIKCYFLPNAFSSSVFTISGVNEQDVFPSAIPKLAYVLIPFFSLLSLGIIIAAIVTTFQWKHRASFVLCSMAVFLQLICFGVTFGFMNRLSRVMLNNGDSLTQGFTSWIVESAGGLVRGLGFLPTPKLEENMDFGPCTFLSYAIFAPLFITLVLHGKLRGHLPRNNEPPVFTKDNDHSVA